MAGSRAKAGPVPGVLGRLAERAYRGEVARRNRAYDRGAGVTDVGAPVVSVGNLSVGGTGKTPTVMRLVEWALADSRRPVIAMRGYGAKHGGASDEQAEYADRFPGVPIVAQPDRIAGLRALGRDAFDAVILDDGFQHRRLARACDIVLIDATRDPFADRCLPAGWLREPVESLRRADAIVITRCDLVDTSAVAVLTDRIREMHPRVTVACARHRWTEMRVVDTDGRESGAGVEWIAGRRVRVAAGIANPGALARQLAQAGARSVEMIALPDHAHWTDAQATRVAREGAGGDAIVVTEKDWVKARHRAIRWPVPVARPVVSMDFGATEGALRTLVDRAFGAVTPDTIGA